MLAYALAAIGRENIKNEPTQAIHLTFQSRRGVFVASNWIQSDSILDGGPHGFPAETTSLLGGHRGFAAR